MRKIIDLTMPLEEGMRGAPGHGRSPLYLSGTRNHNWYPLLNRINPYDEKPVSIHNEQILVCGHTGTHMDSCFHVDAQSEYTIDQIPVEYGFGDAVWLDVSHRFGSGAGITAKDLKDAEERSGTSIRRGDIVLVFTGWSEIQNPVRYAAEHMGLTKDAGEWLREKGVRTVGIDTCNIDALHDVRFPVHMNFLKPRSLGLPDHDFIAIIENLININRIPRSRFLFSGAPIPYVGQTGGQIRALAIVD
jgi:kynurenine formamidase